jgi:hypothetical protein
LTDMALARGFGPSLGSLDPVMRHVTWHSFDLRSGRRGPQLTTRTLGSVSRILNEATETQIDVRIPSATAEDHALYDDTLAATLPGRVMLVAVDDNDQPIWGGLVYKRVSSAAEWMSLNMVTLEAYLDRRYINADVTFTNEDQVSVIAKEVIETTLAYGVEFTIDAPYSNWLRDRTYLIDEDKTILSILQELSGIENGIEFTVDLAWADGDDHMVLDRIFRIRNQVGTAYLGVTGTDSDQPIAIFHMPGAVTDFQYIEDYGSENGANAVVAVSSGEGDARPESFRHIALGIVVGWGGLWAMFEKRFTPSTSITDTTTLDQHAHSELLQTWDGMNELTLEANLDTAPRVNADWFIGDTVAVSLTSQRFPERMNSDGEIVPGYQGNVRCIGWEIDFDARRLKPRLLETTEIEVEVL